MATTVDYMLTPYDSTFEGERSTAAATVGQTVIKGSNSIIINSFLEDRPPVVPDIPEEDAEIRWGAKSSFQYDLTTGDYSRDDDVIIQPDYGSGGGGVTWPDDAEFNEEQPQEGEFHVFVDLMEVARQVEVVRVNGSDGESYVDIERIQTITFELPERRGPTGLIREFWTYHLKWGDT